MTHLETLSLLNWKLSLTEDLLQLFRSCPKLTELRLKLDDCHKLEMNEELKNELRSGCQRLRLFDVEFMSQWIHRDIECWPAIQGIFTYVQRQTIFF
jgi:hypothetical protein